MFASLLHYSLLVDSSVCRWTKSKDEPWLLCSARGIDTICHCHCLFSLWGQNRRKCEQRDIYTLQFCIICCLSSSNTGKPPSILVKAKESAVVSFTSSRSYLQHLHFLVVAGSDYTWYWLIIQSGPRCFRGQDQAPEPHLSRSDVKTVLSVKLLNSLSFITQVKPDTETTFLPSSLSGSIWFSTVSLLSFSTASCTMTLWQVC